MYKKKDRQNVRQDEKSTYSRGLRELIYLFIIIIIRSTQKIERSSKKEKGE